MYNLCIFILTLVSAIFIIYLILELINLNRECDLLDYELKELRKIEMKQIRSFVNSIGKNSPERNHWIRRIIIRELILMKWDNPLRRFYTESLNEVDRKMEEIIDKKCSRCGGKLKK